MGWPAWARSILASRETESWGRPPSPPPPGTSSADLPPSPPGVSPSATSRSFLPETLPALPSDLRSLLPATRAAGGTPTTCCRPQTPPAHPQAPEPAMCPARRFRLIAERDRAGDGLLPGFPLADGPRLADLHPLDAGRPGARGGKFEFFVQRGPGMRWKLLLSTRSGRG